MDWWGPIAAVFAALTFGGWCLDKWDERKHRPKPVIHMRQDFQRTDSYTGEIVGFGVTITNIGSAPMKFVHDPVFFGTGPELSIPDVTQPIVLLPGHAIQRVFEYVDPDTSYMLYGAMLQNGERFRGFLIEWLPLFLDGEMAKEYEKQSDDCINQPPRWVMGRPMPQRVGPGGIPFVLISRQWPKDLQEEWQAMALGEREEQDKQRSWPWRMLFRLWNFYALVTRQTRRKVTPSSKVP